MLLQMFYAAILAAEQGHACQLVRSDSNNDKSKLFYGRSANNRQHEQAYVSQTHKQALLDFVSSPILRVAPVAWLAWPRKACCMREVHRYCNNKLSQKI